MKEIKRMSDMELINETSALLTELAQRAIRDKEIDGDNLKWNVFALFQGFKDLIKSES